MTNEQEQILHTCTKCGKQFTFGKPALDNWAARPENHSKVVCNDCKFGKTSVTTNNKTFKPSVTNGKTTSKVEVASSNSHEMSAELLRRKYDELCAVFADDLESVKDFLGGWTTTLALSATNNRGKK